MVVCLMHLLLNFMDIHYDNDQTSRFAMSATHVRMSKIIGTSGENKDIPQLAVCDLVKHSSRAGIFKH